MSFIVTPCPDGATEVMLEQGSDDFRVDGVGPEFEEPNAANPELVIKDSGESVRSIAGVFSLKYSLRFKTGGLTVLKFINIPLFHFELGDVCKYSSFADTEVHM